ncbi:MAG: pyrrolo-quinoline quinone [Vicinamibacterales bacterium]
MKTGHKTCWSREVRMVLAAVMAVQLSAGCSGRPKAPAYTGTFTRDVDNFRTGLNPLEFALTPDTVDASHFGALFRYDLDGVSDGSPLYVAGLEIPGAGTHNVLFVATEHNSVYAFDADGTRRTPFWQRSFIDPARGVTTVPPEDTGAPLDISPEIGITGTPVIDPGTRTLYVVAKTKEVTGNTVAYRHRLHALDLATGAEKFGGPVIIQASVPGTGVGAEDWRVPFQSLRANQRAALLLSNGVVYVPFGSHGDQQPYHGWLMGYRANDLTLSMVFNSTPNGEGGGIWQSGDGVATDATGNLFFVTGDGTFDAHTGGHNYGNTVIQLSPSGAVLDYFTPHMQAAMDAGDIDLGSVGITLLPDQPGSHPRLGVVAGKNGAVYLLDRDVTRMGGYNPADDSHAVQTLVDAFPNGTFTTGNFKAPVYWNHTIYFSADADRIKSYTLTDGRLSTSPSSRSAFIVNYPGATMSVSANGATNGIVWVLERVDLDPLGKSGVRGPGVLHALDATDLSRELYNSSTSGREQDRLDGAAKWAAPLVANGKVFVATNARLTAFGRIP